MAQGSYAVLIDWNGDGTFTGTTEDVTARTLEASWSRGRDFASQLAGRSISGQLSLELNNQSGDYSPFNIASPLYGSLLPGRKIQVKGGTGTANNILWTGYIQYIEPAPENFGLNRVVITGLGPLGYLNQLEAIVGMLTNQTTGSAFGTLLDRVGWGTARSIDPGKSVLLTFWNENKKVLDAMREIEETEAGFVAEGKDASIIFEDRHHRLVEPYLTSQATFTDATGGTLVYVDIKQEDPLRYITNVFEAPVKTYSSGSLTVLWQFSGTGTNSRIIRGGGELVLWTQYPNSASPTNAIGVSLWIDPASGTDYTANSNPSGTGGVDLTSSVVVTTAPYGNSMEITLVNNANQDAYLGKLQARGYPLQVADLVSVKVIDSTSSSLYGTRSYQSQSDFIPDTEEALDWARQNLAIYSEPGQS